MITGNFDIVSRDLARYLDSLYDEDDFREWARGRKDAGLGWPCDSCERYCSQSCRTFPVMDKEEAFYAA